MMNSFSISIQKQIVITSLGGLCLLSDSCIQESKKQEENKLNIVFLLADDLRWNSLGCMGNTMLQTKNIDALSTNGIRFTNARVTTSISMVSRATLLTGQYMSRHGIKEFGVPLDEGAFSHTYPAILKKAGYWTGYVGKYGVGKIRENDFDYSVEYEGKHWLPCEKGDSIHVTEKNADDALNFLKTRPKDTPFLLSVGFFATHAQDNHPDQYLYQPESEELYRHDIIPVPETASDTFFKSLPWFLATDANEGRIRWHWRFDTPEKYQKYMKAYYRMLTELDLAIGQIIAELKNQGVYENTLIIFMGDNGYFHGEHGLADKWYPYEESIRVPLIVHDPRLLSKAGNIVRDEFVLNIDIAPAIVAAAGLPVPQGMQGKDFSKLYLSGKPRRWRKDFYYEHPVVTNENRIPTSEALVTHTGKYIFWPYYKYEEYFDLKNDPFEKHNGIRDAENSGKIQVMKKRFAGLKEKASCSQAPPGNPTFAQIESGFKNIPDSIQTSVYWYWISDNISGDGVVKDLYAMKKAGINRAFIGNIGLNDVPYGKVKIFSDEWWHILHTALKTASELNIEIGIFNSPGWSQSGGPWVKNEQSMRYLNSSEIKVNGPMQFKHKLATPNVDFQLVNVIAYKVPVQSDRNYKSLSPIITSEPELENISSIFDGNHKTEVSLEHNKTLTIDFRTIEEATVRTLIIKTSERRTLARGELLTKDGNVYRSLKNFEINRSNPNINVGFEPFAPIVLSIPETRSKIFRLIISEVAIAGGIAEAELSPVPKVERYPEKSLAKMFQTPLPYWNDYLWPVQPELNDQSMVIDPEGVLDISKNIASDGTLTWTVPPGNWIIMQTGMTTTGQTNGPASPGGTGLETDKMSKKHIASHFDAFLGEIIRRVPAVDRKTWKIVVEDSYETGGQNWTDDFIEEFMSKYGYSPVPYIPALKGNVVGSRDLSDRFLWDLRRLIADKVSYDYVGGLREVSHKHGLTTWLENYGHWGFPGEFLQYGGQSDEVGGEFWSEGDLGNIENRAASSCAHIYGKTRVSAESFTCGGKAYSRYPATMKPRGDRFFTEGINNTLLHVYIQQPAERAPGINAWFGNEFNRHNTWFSQMDIFIQYLKRTNFMLQQGKYVADVAYFIGEDVPKMTGICDPALPKGYSFDYINAEVIHNRVSVKDGKIMLPDGMTYRLLVLPELKTMRPELLKKIMELVRQGAVVLGPAPEYSPSLQNYPEADQIVRQMASDLWGKVDGKIIKSAKVGRGMILSGMEMQEALDFIKVVSDCRFADTDPALFIHRNNEDGDLYFISNQSDKVITINPQFRIAGKCPELWDANTGTVRDLPAYTFQRETTIVPLKLEPFESAFIVFRKKSGKPQETALAYNYPDSQTVTELKNPWIVTFDEKNCGPVKPVKFESLQDWILNINDSIKYYSGTAVYKTYFTLGQVDTKSKLFINLGIVKSMAKVRLNGKESGGVWTAPWTLDISAFAKTGINTLEVEVVNTWVNRLIGDSKLPEEKRTTWCTVNPYNPGSPLEPSGLLGPVKIQKFVFSE